MKKPIAIAILSLLLLSLVSSTTVSPIESETPLPVKEGNCVYIDDANAYISASPHTLTADGYVYLNITSKSYGGEVDFCFGFDSKLGYPRSLELYDPKTETTQHELDLNPYWNNPQYKIEFSDSTNKTDEVIFNSCVSVYYNTSIINENNQTVGWKWTNTLEQCFDVGYLDTRMFYWNTTQSSSWTSIRKELNFDQKPFNFGGMDTWYLANATVQKNKEYYLRMWLTLVPTLEDATHEFFVGLKPHHETLGQAVSNNRFYYLDPWYDNSWQYRKQHNITSAAGAGVNYPMRIHVHYGSGADYQEDAYLNSKCQPNFDDIRFTNSTGTGLLDYWIEEKTDLNNAVFWVEISGNLSSSNQTIYLYYGNSEASTTKNGEDTFIRWDDFDDGYSVGNSPKASRGWTVNKDGSDTVEIDNNPSGSGKVLKIDEGGGVQSSGVFNDLGGSTWESLAIHFKLRLDTTSLEHYIYGEESGTHRITVNWGFTSGYAKWYDGSSYNDYSPPLSYSADTWYKIAYNINGTNGDYVDIIKDGTEYNGDWRSTPTSGIDEWRILVAYFDAGKIWIDNFFVRKSVDPEPSHGDWGHPEEIFTFPDDWQYRKSHTINYNGDAGVNYPVRIKVYSGSDDDSGEDVYLNGKCRTDFGDVRFADSTGWTLLDYWMEKNTTNYAIFWVEVPANLSASSTTIYIYYGNVNASRADNPLGLDIFQIREYDLYSNALYDPDYAFTKNTSSIILADSYTADVYSMGRGYIFIQAKKADLDGKKLNFYWQCYRSASATETLGYVYVVDNPHLRTKTTDEFADNDDTEHPVSDYTNSLLLTLSHSGTGWTSWNNSTSEVIDLSSFSSEYVTILISAARDAWYGETVMLDLGYMKILDSNNITLKTFDFDESVVMEQTGTIRDYGLYRKYVAGYNPHGSWGTEQSLDPWYSFAFLIWGTTYYAEYMGGDDERDLSGNVSMYIFDLVDDTQRYGNNVHNYWGDPTKPNNVYANVSHAETNYNYTAIFYKGHSYPAPGDCNVTGCSFQHYALYDDEGLGVNATEWIIDYLIHNETSSGTHDFVFLWTCGYGQDDLVGEIDENGHSWGMLASWMNINGTNLSNDGYNNSEYSDHVFISFENISIWFTNYTTYDTYQYAHFAYLFFDYALNGPFTVRDALDLAAEDTHGPEVPSFGDCQLYTGYEILDPRTNSTVIGKMRIWGDGEHLLPN